MLKSVDSYADPADQFLGGRVGVAGVGQSEPRLRFILQKIHQTALPGSEGPLVKFAKASHSGNMGLAFFGSRNGRPIKFGHSAGRFWVLAGFARFLHGFCWFLLVLAGSAWFWLVLVGSGWF